MLRGFERTGATAHRHALAAREIVAIADEFGGGVRSITVVEQPAEVVRGGAQHWKLTRAKELFVLGSLSAMGLMSRHNFTSVCG
jgi:hypothetical protein